MGEIRWYLQIIYRPREAVKHFLVNQPKTEKLMTLVVVYGGLAFPEEALSGERPSAFMPIYFAIGWLAFSAGAFLVGRVLGGKGTVATSLIAVAITFTVPSIFMPVSIPLNYCQNVAL